MKKVFEKSLIILLILAAVFAVTIYSCALYSNVASADTSKKVVVAPVSNLKDNAYAQKSSIALHVKDNESTDVFFIPESYYLENPRLMVFATDIYRVEYAGEDDFFVDAKYIATEEISFIRDVTFKDDQLPLYPDFSLTLLEDAVIDGETVSQETHSVKFLGYSEDGTSYYVKAESLNSSAIYGFIGSDKVQPFNVPYHPISQIERESLISADLTPQPSAGDLVPKTSVALRIIIILGIAIPAVMIALLMFKSSKDNKVKQSNERSEKN